MMKPMNTRRPKGSSGTARAARSLLRRRLAAQDPLAFGAFSPVGRYLLAGSFRSRPKLWDLDQALDTPVQDLAGGEWRLGSGTVSAAFSADGRYFAIGDRDGLINVYEAPAKWLRRLDFRNVPDEDRPRTEEIRPDQITSLAFDPKDPKRLLATQGPRAYVWAWDSDPARANVLRMQPTASETLPRWLEMQGQARLTAAMPN